MAQITQHPLLSTLLLWTTLVSIIQVVFFIILFTGGFNVMSQNSDSPEPTPVQQSHSTTPFHSENGLRLGRGKMLTFRATQASSTIQWMTKSQTPGLISEAGESLTIMKGGYFLISLQVTLSSCEKAQLTRTVSLKLNNEVILVGWIHATTKSTGLLSKVEEVSTGMNLRVTINPPVKCFNDSESVTHLDIVYLSKS